MTMTTSKEGGSNLTYEPIRLTHTKPVYNNEEAVLAARQDLWHKFIVFNSSKYEKSDVLKGIINACEPEILLPVMYRTENTFKSTFLAKCNSAAIENLVKQDLVVPLHGGHELYIDIVLGFLNTEELPLNPNKVVTQALCHRYESTKKVLNLDDFENEKSLGPIFCPISIPKIFHFILRCTKQDTFGNNRESKLPIRELSLKHNKLTAIILFEKFFNFHLTKLDIRYNHILDIEYLHYFSEFKITELWLDGNPLCTKYNTPQEYIQSVKNIFPHLQKLDGIVIGMEQKVIPNTKTHFLGDGSKTPLVKQFIKHFFTLYDQDDRMVMNGLYDKHALYSMTLGSAGNYIYKHFPKAFISNRNLLKFVDYAKCHEFLLRGPEKIIWALRRQPATYHDLETFNVDILHTAEKFVAISVQGLFSYKQIPSTLLSFNRTFVIVEKDDYEYCIANDQYYIDSSSINISPNETVRSEPKVAPKFVAVNFSPSEKRNLLDFLKEVTTMNETFCLKYLEEADWDVRNAIITFMQMYTMNDIPLEAFQ